MEKHYTKKEKKKKGMEGPCSSKMAVLSKTEKDHGNIPD